MKKNLIYVLFLFFTPVIIFAREVEKKEAWLVAQNFMTKRNYITSINLPKQSPISITKIDHLYTENSREILAYIAKLEPKGFVIISCNTDIEPVIAYSFRHNWNPDTSQANIFCKILKYDLEMRAKSVPFLTSSAVEANHSLWQSLLNSSPSEVCSYSFRQWPQEGMTSTSGWVESTWHQSSPYNNFCPIDPGTGNRSIVGCVATALAQVVNYHKTIGTLHFDADDSYTMDTREIHIDSDSTLHDFPSFLRLNGYLDELEFKYQNNGNLVNQDLAALCFSCGIVVQMDYTSSSSGADVASLASILKSNFGYYSADYKAGLVNEKSTSNFYSGLQENMMNALPGILQIGVSANYKIHAVVCDGYNTDNFYHLNFGWGSGSPDDIEDAWYLLPNGMPAGYKLVLSAIININPDLNYQEEITTDKELVYLEACIVGNTSRYDSFTLRNAGSAAIDIHYIVSSEHFLISRTTIDFSDSLGPAILEPGNDMTIYALCIPNTIGPIHGQAIVHSTAVNPFLNIHLSGFGAPEGGTIISRGDVAGVWDKAHSPYYICGDITVATGGKLHITSGTEVIFLDRFKLTTGTNAQLIAKGAISDSIYFHALNSTEGWSGLEFRESGDDDTLAYCIISDGKGNPEDYDYGGAISIYSSSPTFMNSRLANNQATFGGAIYCIMGNPSIKFTTIENNYATDSGGALYLDQSSPIIENTVFCKNSANSNGAFLHSRTSSPTFINITVANNVDGQNLGGFMYLASDNDITFKNSILWTNEGDNLEIHMDKNNTLEFEYSDILTTYLYEDWPIIGYAYQHNKIIWGSGNIATSPLLTRSDSLDYVLHEQSPCIDAGNPGSEYNDSEDHDNPGFALWPAMGTIRNDMGAYGGHSIQFVVPVELALFQAKASDNDVLLTWETLSESNNFGFEIERGSDDHSFFKIAFVKGNGTTTAPHKYSYADENLKAREYYYRLKQIDNSGVFNYSEPIKVNMTMPLSYSLSQNYPNPFNSLTMIQFAVPYPSDVEIIVYNTLGKQVKTLVQDVKKTGVHKVIWNGKDEFDNYVSNGCYFIKMQAERFRCIKKLLMIK